MNNGRTVICCALSTVTCPTRARTAKLMVRPPFRPYLEA
jgi:hypothetical protein